MGVMLLTLRRLTSAVRDTRPARAAGTRIFASSNSNGSSGPALRSRCGAGASGVASGGGMATFMPRLSGIGRLELRGGNRFAAPAHAELAVDGDRLRLHGVARDAELVGDLAKREVRREEWEQPQLSRRKPTELESRPGGRGDVVPQSVRTFDEVAELRPHAQDSVDLVE